MPIRKPFAVIPLLPGPMRTGNARANRPATNLALLDHHGMTWKTNGSVDAWVAGEFDEATSVDFVAMISADALPGTTIRIRLGTSEAAVDGTSATYDSGVQSFISPAISHPGNLYHSHREFSPKNVSHWRIDIGGHTGDFEASGLVIGKRIEASRFYDNDHERGIEDLGSLDIGRNGVVSEVPGVVLRTLQFRFSWLTRTEYEEQYRPMIEQLATRGISYWCFDPEPGPYRQDKTYLGYFGRSPFARPGVKPDRYAMEFQIRSII